MFANTSVRRTVFACVFCSFLSCWGSSPLWAENEGMTDLDQATELKLGAESLSDLAEVIRLCRKAIREGLDEDNAKFAREMLAGTLTQRAEIVSAQIFIQPKPPASWPELRRIALADLEETLELHPEQANAHYMLGRLQALPGGDRKRALTATDEAIRLSTNDPQHRAQALLIRAGLATDEEHRAGDLDEAIKTSPRNFDALRMRGLYLLGQQKFEKAIADLAAALVIDKENIDLWEAKGVAEGEIKKYDDALKSFDHALELAPESTLFYRYRANVLSLKNDPQGALAELNKALEIDGRSLPTLLLRAEIHQKLGKTDDALADVDQAIRLQPRSIDALRMRILLNAGGGKYDQALEDLDDLANLVPNNPAVLLMRARVYQQAGKSDKALDELNQLLGNQPKSIEALHSRALLLASNGKFDQSIEDLNELQKLAPDNLTVLLLRAGVYQHAGKIDKAFDDVNEVLKRDPKSTDALQMHAVLSAGTGKFDQAIDDLEDLKKLAPDNASILVQLGLFYTADKKPVKALNAFNEVLTADAKNWMAHRGRADAYLNLGKQAEALADYEAALQQQPDNSGILNNLAWILSTSPDDKLRDGKRAIELATEACEITKYQEAHILSTLAAGYAETGDFENAIVWSKKAVEAGSPQVKDQLLKELESYQQKKPWREATPLDGATGSFSTDSSESKTASKADDDKDSGKDNQGQPSINNVDGTFE